MEQALRESEQRFRKLADTATVGIWATEPSKVVSFCYKTALTLAGVPWSSLLEIAGPNLRIATIWIALISLTFALSPPAAVAVSSAGLPRLDGQYCWVLNTGIPHFVDSVYVGHRTVIDIPDIKRSHEQMLASQKLESLGVRAAGIRYRRRLAG